MEFNFNQVIEAADNDWAKAGINENGIFKGIVIDDTGSNLRVDVLVEKGGTTYKSSNFQPNGQFPRKSKDKITGDEVVESKEDAIARETNAIMLTYQRIAEGFGISLEDYKKALNKKTLKSFKEYAQFFGTLMQQFEGKPCKFIVYYKNGYLTIPDKHWRTGHYVVAQDSTIELKVNDKLQVTKDDDNSSDDSSSEKKSDNLPF